MEVSETALTLCVPEIHQFAIQFGGGCGDGVEDEGAFGTQ